MKRSLFIGSSPIHAARQPVTGRQVVLDGQEFYLIANYDRMRPFFMSIVSASDLWMFISSTGALTAGRRNPDGALFPYYTDDKIHDSAEITGSKTILIVEQGGRRSLWEPFSDRYRGAYQVQRNLYKNAWGNQLVFEECNQDLGLTFRYRWSNSDRFGFVRQSWLTRQGAGACKVTLVDGLQNLMPCGVGSAFQMDKSTLLDAYKRNELVPATGLGIFRLSSIPIDRPEPAEALRTTTVWSIGLPGARHLLSSVQLDRFRQGQPVQEETDVRAERGAYFLSHELNLKRGATATWLMAADVNRGPSDVAGLNQLLRRPARLEKLVLADVAAGSTELGAIVARADGFQKTAQPLGDIRHGNNVLFNVMRGGIFADGYRIDPADLQASVAHANRDVAQRQSAFFRKLKPGTAYARVVELAAATGDAQLERLCREYLPLTFSRRHGDPSRPWNRFSIITRNPDGTRVLNYEGNWRDIFQNWEALAVSYPAYLPGMICRFVSASTADGYNPYRVTRDGIDWEVIDPHDPWAHIGYWGDHQLIYLLKLLELLQAHEPATLRSLLTRDLFAYANVPYRIKPYAGLLANPKETVSFDTEADALARRRVAACGSDGKLVWDSQDRVRLVNLTEKLLVSLLAKLVNFIPEAGIWLNTQRPEWNDANNALVGNGVSMVTLYYLRRHLAFCRDLFGALEQVAIPVSQEVAGLFAAVTTALERHQPLLGARLDDRLRKRVLDDLGKAGSEYRETLYTRGLSGERPAVPVAQLLRFFNTALEWTDHSLAANRRPDQLYHAYNLVKLDQPSAIPIRRLYEMLEGQVAVLSSGRLGAEESLGLLTALRLSAMYRADQHSYLLYPNRQLPRFVERNQLPAKAVEASRLLTALVAAGDRSLIERDVYGACHFAGSLTNAAGVRQALEHLARNGYAALVKRDSALVLDLFERLFDHQSFTGRSGTFFGYEGLGSIYWHMVSKLLLAVQETFFRAVEANAAPDVLQRLSAAYYDVRAGIGDQKTPEVYGAFPTDPYSHTPAHAGARQPGLTGQVKEDLLCRWGELGVSVRAGCLEFRPRLLRPSEFLTAKAVFQYYDALGASRSLRLPAGSLAFTYCQVPILYRQGAKAAIVVFLRSGKRLQPAGMCLDAALSRSIFHRTGEVARIEVTLADL